MFARDPCTSMDVDQTQEIASSPFHANCQNASFPIITPETAPDDHLEYTTAGVSLILDVRDFAINEITCKISKLQLEVVAESNRIGRCKLFRKYLMPQNLAPQHGSCNINTQGVLHISVPWEK